MMKSSTYYKRKKDCSNKERERIFFVNPKFNRVRYNEKCVYCQRACKQSYQVLLWFCRSYLPQENGQKGTKAAVNLKTAGNQAVGIRETGLK